MIWSNSAARGTQITSNVCVDARFRPTEAYARYWIAGKYRGSGWARIEIDSIQWLSQTPDQHVTSATVAAPARFSVGTHPSSGDAWHIAALEKPGATEALSFTFERSGPATEPLTAAWVKIPFEQGLESTVEGACRQVCGAAVSTV